MLYSIIIPVYNRRDYLKRAIESVIIDVGNTIPKEECEIIVVDDGSTDDTADLARSYGAPVLFVQQEHEGAQSARNRGLFLSTGRYVRFLDSDDRLAQGITQSQLAVMVNSNYDIVYSDWYDEYEPGADHAKENQFRSRHDWSDPILELLNDKWNAPFCYLIKGDLARSQAWHLSLSACQDSDYVLQLALRGSTFKYVPALTGYYCHHSGSRVSSDSKLRWAQSKVLTLERAISTITSRNMWTTEYRVAVASSLHRTAPLLFREDRAAYRKTIALAQSICPDFTFDGTLYSSLVYLAGFEATEHLRDFRRRLRRHAKQR